ncbi:hypothetical protein MKZ38_005752 [Zalerion maritima]|uniref:Uncharacterized protein n=1 Tax=Zalerion maritima TaxID=339359 RepID=A0AAD5RKC8_9PEZI|nr:hypothetical protein MKZ38_005752 [Zalerion maritima]
MADSKATYPSRCGFAPESSPDKPLLSDMDVDVEGASSGHPPQAAAAAEPSQASAPPLPPKQQPTSPPAPRQQQQQQQQQQQPRASRTQEGHGQQQPANAARGPPFWASYQPQQGGPGYAPVQHGSAGAGAGAGAGRAQFREPPRAVAGDGALSVLRRGGDDGG